MLSPSSHEKNQFLEVAAKYDIIACMQDVKNFLANLTHHPGVYQMLDERGDVIYVGKAKDVKKRITSYFTKQSHDLKTLSLMEHVKSIEVTLTNTETEAVLLECNLIKKHRPRYNVVLRDDKSYPYILITIQHKYPRIDLYRGVKKKKALYFGPYPSAYAVRETISLLQKIFLIRTCRDTYFDSRIRPCLLYQINRCTGPCVNLISEEEYRENVNLAILFLEGKSSKVVSVLQQKMEAASTTMNYEKAAYFRDQIVRLRQIQNRQYVNVKKGNADILGYAENAGVSCIQLLSIRGGQVLGSRTYFPVTPIHSKSEEILSAFISQHYLYHPSHKESIPKQIILTTKLDDKEILEEALSQESNRKVEILFSVRGERKKWLEMAITSAKQSLALQIFNQTNMKGRIIALQKCLELDEFPNRIECFDISHSMGEATVASCVSFDQAGPIKSDYRRFNITNITKGDDYAAMRQVLTRRFKKLVKDEARLPDVVILDGGQIQLNAAKEVFSELNIKNVLLVAIAKGPLRKPGFETIIIDDKKPIHLPSDSNALHFIQQIRDEAHHFAITGNRNRIVKARKQSTLELIPGVGTKRRRDLLRYFGGIQGLIRASLEELIRVPGINSSLAERIFATLHDTTI